MSKFKVWLAGKMSGLSYEEMNTWRVNAKRLLRITSEDKIRAINPVDFYNFELNPDTYTEKEVKEFDLHLVKASDLILVNLEHPDSIGTAIELYLAHDILNKPVIGFGLNKDNPCHPWMELCLTKECETLEESVDYIVNYYLGNI